MAKVELEQERDRLLRELEALEAAEQGSAHDEGRSYATHHRADDATETADRETALALARHIRTALFEVERALRKIEGGTYGLCDDCGVPIEDARIDIRPQALFCLACQTRRENQP